MSVDYVHIVMVDDNAPFIEVLSQALSRRDPRLMVVATAVTAEEGAMVIELHQPDVVLLDIRLPGASGISLATSIHLKWPAIRIIMLTAESDMQTTSQALAVGASAYILKDAPIPAVIEAVWRAYHTNPYHNTALLEDLDQSILQSLGTGLSIETISRLLNVPIADITVRLQGLYSKTETQSIPALLFSSLEQGWLKPS